jgi:hypothetical protein
VAGSVTDQTELVPFWITHHLICAEAASRDVANALTAQPRRDQHRTFDVVDGNVEMDAVLGPRQRAPGNRRRSSRAAYACRPTLQRASSWDEAAPQPDKLRVAGVGRVSGRLSWDDAARRPDKLRIAGVVRVPGRLSSRRHLAAQAGDHVLDLFVCRSGGGASSLDFLR